jgi:NAD(P)H-nitrite reductase large subunit
LIKNWVESKGVKVHTNTKVESIAPSGDALQVKLSDGSVLTVDLVIAAAGVRPNIAYLKDSGIEMATGILVDSQMQTSCADIYAAGDVTESIDFSTGKRIVNAIQPNAAEQAHIAATNMAGGSAKSTGSLQINVLDTLGLISTSFGQWWGAEQGGQHVEIKDPAAYKYLRLEFDGNHLIGATSLGMTEHVGALRGLIQTRAPLGPWKAKLLHDPTRLMEAYLATAQAQSAWTS